MRTAAVTSERWSDLAELFTRKGPRGGTPVTAWCWCMWWRRRAGDGGRNRTALRRLVRGGGVPGLLAYEGERPVGWVAVAPRRQYEQLVRSRLYGPRGDDGGDGDEVWAVTCFYVPPGAKRQGIASELLDAAVERAFTHGAAVVEAYPHRRGDYMGVPSMFERLGFEPVRDAGPRTVVRLAR